MFNKRLIAEIVLNHSKLLEKEEGSCEIVTLDTKGLLTDEENELIKKHLNSACDLLRKAYIKRMELKENKFRG